MMACLPAFYASPNTGLTSKVEIKIDQAEREECTAQNHSEVSEIHAHGRLVTGMNASGAVKEYWSLQKKACCLQHTFIFSTPLVRTLCILVAP